MCLKKNRIRGYFENRSSLFRGFTVHNSISLRNISKYFRSTKKLALYQNDNYLGSNENELHTSLSRSARKPNAARIKRGRF